MARSFSEREKAILRIVQGDLPHSIEPYADVAGEAGCAEADVLALLRELKNSGAIRRFGATIRHQRAGWGCNTMAGWAATEAEAGKYGPAAAENPLISHVYYRPSPAPDWPYTLYTMIHGRDESQCREVVDWLLDRWPLRDYALLSTVRELKKISMTYFA